MSHAALKDAIRNAALEAGYADCAFTTADPFNGYAAVLEKRAAAFPNAAGLYEEMQYRVDPRGTAPWAGSILVCALPYNGFVVPPEIEGRIGKHYLFDRRYPGHPDHDVPVRMKAALQGLGIRAKRGGVPERLSAARSGLAAFGRNCFAYHPLFGSWFNIESYRLGAATEPDDPSWDISCPEGCRKCIDACPTGALQAPLHMDLTRCIAYLSYSATLPIDPETEARMGRWIYGCDVCQDVCPMNRGKWKRAGKAGTAAKDIRFSDTEKWMREPNNGIGKPNRRPRDMERPAAPEKQFTGSSLEPAPWIESHVRYLKTPALATMDLETYRREVHPLFWYISDDETGLQRWRHNAARSLSADAG